MERRLNAIVFGLATLWPHLCFHGARLLKAAGVEWAGEPTLTELGVLTGACLVGANVLCVFHARRNPRVEAEGSRRTWTWVLLLLGYCSAPAYWYLHVWREPRGYPDWRSRPMLLLAIAGCVALVAGGDKGEGPRQVLGVAVFLFACVVYVAAVFSDKDLAADGEWGGWAVAILFFGPIAMVCFWFHHIRVKPALRQPDDPEQVERQLAALADAPPGERAPG